VSKCTSLISVSDEGLHSWKSALTIWVGARRTGHDNTGRDTRCLAATSDVGKYAIDGNSCLSGDEGIEGCLTTLKIKR
jgi:hypothetical protein